MVNKDNIQPMVCIWGTNAKETLEIRHLFHHPVYTYQTEICTGMTALKSGLASRACIAAILDLDSVPLDNRTIKALASEYPEVRLLCASRERFHPELKDAISHHIFACLTKPIDPDELHYFLKCIRDDLGWTR